MARKELILLQSVSPVAMSQRFQFVTRQILFLETSHQMENVMSQ